MCYFYLNNLMNVSYMQQTVVHMDMKRLKKKEKTA